MKLGLQFWLDAPKRTRAKPLDYSLTPAQLRR